MANGEIQHEFTDTLSKVGAWVKQYGHSIYGTRGGPMNAENWGVTTQNEEHVYLHVLGDPGAEGIFIPGKYQISNIKGVNVSNKIPVTAKDNGVWISTKAMDFSIVDNIIVLPKAK